MGYIGWLALLLAAGLTSSFSAGQDVPPAARPGGIYIPLERGVGPPRALLRRNGTLPLHGAVREGYFYARLALGTPPREYAMIIDTGSTITYVPCAGCRRCGKHTSRAFDPFASSTALVLPCGHARCTCGSPRCGCDDGRRCTYSRGYAEQSASSGLLVLDKVSLPDGGPPADLAFGCALAESGEIYRQAADGIIGLGNNANALHSQLAAAGAVERMFGLCFGFPAGGALLLGSALPAGQGAAAAPLAWTPLLPSATPYYVVALDAIAVAGAALAVDPAEYAVGYGAVVDSGTTFTYLPSRAFRAFLAAITAAADRAGLARAPGPDPEFPDVCWRGAPPAFDLGGVFPTAAMRFRGGAELRLPPHRYLFAAGAAGEYCLGVFDNGDAGTLIGGIAGRNTLVVYDLERGRVGFGDADCPALGAAAAAAAASRAAASSLQAATPAPSAQPSPPPSPSPSPAAAPAPRDAGQHLALPRPTASSAMAGTAATAPKAAKPAAAAAAAAASSMGTATGAAAAAAAAAAAVPLTVAELAELAAPRPAGNATTSSSNDNAGAAAAEPVGAAAAGAGAALALPPLRTPAAVASAGSADKTALTSPAPDRPQSSNPVHIDAGAAAAAAAAAALAALAVVAAAAMSGRIPALSGALQYVTGRARFERLPSGGGGGGGGDLEEAELTPLARAGRAGGGSGSGSGSSGSGSGNQQSHTQQQQQQPLVAL